MGQVYVGQSGNGADLSWIEWQWGRFELDRVAMGQVCVGQSGTEKGFCATTCFRMPASFQQSSILLIHLLF